MTKGTEATVEVKLKKSKSVELLEKILERLEAIEKQGKPVEVVPNIRHIQTGGASRAAFADSPFNKPEAKEFMDDMITKVAQAGGEPVTPNYPQKKTRFETIRAGSITALDHSVSFAGGAFEVIVKAQRLYSRPGLMVIEGKSGTTLTIHRDTLVPVLFRE